MLIKDFIKKIPFLKRINDSIKNSNEQKLIEKISRELKISPIHKKVLFYPNQPKIRASLLKIFKVLHYLPVYSLNEHYDFVCSWQDATYKQIVPELAEISQKRMVLNLKSVDISKFKVDEICTEVLGYSTQIDPRTFKGKCVKKSNINGEHSGVVLNCPVLKKDEGFIYQILINNEIKKDIVEDLRVPFIKNTIPFVYLHYRNIKNRFISEKLNTKLAKTEDVFSSEEIKQIAEVCQRIGVDYAELDILRNRDNHKIYIVDVNDTPGGFSPKLTAKDKENALYLYAKCFYENFIQV